MKKISFIKSLLFSLFFVLSTAEAALPTTATGMITSATNFGSTVTVGDTFTVTLDNTYDAYQGINVNSLYLYVGSVGFGGMDDSFGDLSGPNYIEFTTENDINGVDQLTISYDFFSMLFSDYLTVVAVDTTGQANGVRDFSYYDSIQVSYQFIDDSGYSRSFTGVVVATNNDVDMDGFDVAEDCNDNDATIYPGAIEIKHDGIDQDCNAYDLTIDVTKAVVKSKGGGLLSVIATSSLGASADLSVDGFGVMNYNTRKDKWSLTVRKPASLPASITVSGIEGSETVPTTTK